MGPAFADPAILEASAQAMSAPLAMAGLVIAAARRVTTCGVARGGPLVVWGGGPPRAGGAGPPRARRLPPAPRGLPSPRGRRGGGGPAAGTDVRVGGRPVGGSRRRWFALP